MTQYELSENLDGPTLFQPEAGKDKIEAQLIRYSGEKYLMNFPTLDEIVRENGDEGLSAILENEIANHRNILFMAIENE
ncbi:15557_t:CDS:1, partial [Dentiscutata heterogama]